MGSVTADQPAPRSVNPFNSPVEIGLRALVLLTEEYPRGRPLQRLVVMDYLVVHSDDLADGPPGLHPKTPHRRGELFVRRGVLLAGLTLYRSRGLIAEQFCDSGLRYSATERAAPFLDGLGAAYLDDLRKRAAWVRSRLEGVDDESLQHLISEQVGSWAAEFTYDSVLWSREAD